ncbi:hypothetical protein [Alienimonas chondri]|uniref:PEP-CTERM sorting domain-containing protein n=1 Tax=Alienimonas chondri TaxID=2681879 RepID=A0ABX1VGY7_9PLAN|nr:hypothetical protein [Alienimonas chondri]NNJ27388.1 hypothetical protein [Alienimonas chondri]
MKPLLLIAALSPLPASAGVSVYTDRPTFEDALNGGVLTTETFVAAGTPVPGGGFEDFRYSNLTVLGGRRSAIGNLPDGYGINLGLTGTGPTTVAEILLPGPANAVAFDLFDAFEGPDTIEFGVEIDGVYSPLLRGSNAPNSSTQFVGFVDTSRTFDTISVL